jgi:hypothetical protein
MELIVASKNDVIAVELETVRSMFSSKVDMTKRADSYSLRDRHSVLDETDDPPTPLHIILANQTKIPQEKIYRCVQKHLLDWSTDVFLFTIDFFNVGTRDMFNQVFARTLSLCLEQIENYLFQCFDAIGLLLMIQITSRHQQLMKMRRVATLATYFDRVNLMLWPRFQAVFSGHLASLQTAKLERLGNVELTPHYVTRHYAQWVSAVLVLQGHTNTSSSSSSASSSSGRKQGAGRHYGKPDTDRRNSDAESFLVGDEMIVNDLAQLRVGLVSLLARLSTKHHKEAKLSMIFLINNYSCVLSQMDEANIDSEETSAFRFLLKQQQELFVEEELQAHFPELVEFVPNAELQLHKAKAGGVPEVASQASVDIINRKFASTWKDCVRSIHDNTLKYFANFRNGMDILKMTLTQMMLYYNRLQDVIGKIWKGATLLAFIVPSLAFPPFVRPSIRALFSPLLAFFSYLSSFIHPSIQSSHPSIHPSFYTHFLSTLHFTLPSIHPFTPPSFLTLLLPLLR